MGGSHEYHGRCSVLWGDTIPCILSTMGDIMILVGRYHEYCGGVQYHGGTGTQIRKDFSPTVLMISPCAS